MHHKTTILVAPPLPNSSCSQARFTQLGFLQTLGPGEILQAIIILLLTVGVLASNLVLILVINSRRYSKYIHSQPRYLLTSLASNDLAMGLFVTPFAIVPALRHCWPYGELVCQIQALLRGAISQQSAVILICMAMDRYLCMLHPARYHKHSSKKGCVAIISMTWIMSVTLFSILVLPRGGYYFNPTGMLACEPFYTRASVRILTACGFYFPTTMILMYCYGSAFHVNKLRLRRSTGGGGGGGCNTISSPEEYPPSAGASIEKLVTQERRLSTSASRTMAAMSLGFIVLVTPWTIQEVVAACTGSKAPPSLDFAATWLALSNSFWNPFLYWLLNGHFRRISRELLFSSRLFCNTRRRCPTSPPHHFHQHPPFELEKTCCSNSGSAPHLTQPPGGGGGGGDCDPSEKYWGEILERTLSSSSLHALQRAYSHPRLDRCVNGGLYHNHHHYLHHHHHNNQEMMVFDTAVPDL